MSALSVLCLSMSVISLCWPRLCILLIFPRQFHVISWMHSLLSSFAFFLMVLYISADALRCLTSPFPTCSPLFVIRVSVGDGIIDLSSLLIALATLVTLCWINDLFRS